MAFPWDQLITAAAGVGGGLGGVWLTLRHDRLIEGERRAEARRDALRNTLIELILASRQWIELRQVFVVSLARMEYSDVIEFTDTDTGKKMGVNAEQVKRTFSQALLQVGDDLIREPVERAAKLINDAPEKLIGPIYPSRHRATGDKLREAVADGKRYLESLAADIDQVEAAASKALQISLVEEPRRTATERPARQPPPGMSTTG